ncbi:MAG: hypothetical protein ACD_48C00611G0003 [uncultured bacterium]|nr:MAG: hypothetical protein ACD_48C00611G0003 [uncultured bacterium]
MSKINLNNIVWKEGAHYVSLNLNSGVSSFGKTKKQALSALQEAVELYFEDMPISKISKVGKPDVVSSVFVCA